VGGGLTKAKKRASDTPPRAFVAFAGGGAKGLVHVGALRALEKRKVEVQGYAGTSAGAIIAALAAAGVTSDDMIHPTEDRSIIDELRRFDPDVTKLTDLFGPRRWPTIKALGLLADRMEKAGLPTEVMIIFGFVLTAVLLTVTAFVSAIHGWVAAIIVMMVWVALLSLASIPFCLAASGLAQVETFRNSLGLYLSERLFGPGSTREVLMSDFDGITRPRLKIVASDITRQRMQLFSSDERAETPVADAVAASICLPLVFAPKRIAGVRFVDGGVVSNFPAWPFDEERALDGDAMTIGFQIGEPAQSVETPKRAAVWPVAVIQTALFGSVQLSTRAVGRAELITLKPSLKLLAFDITLDRARQEVADATRGALAEIDRRLFRFPEIYRSACENARNQALRTLETSPSALRNPRRIGRIRCAVALPRASQPHSLAVRYGVGYEDDADGDLLLPIAASLAGEAWRTGTAKYEPHAIKRGKELHRQQDAALRRRVPRDLAWSLRVPISNSKRERVLVVLVDGSGVLNDSDDAREWVETFADTVEKLFQPVVRQFEEEG